MKMAPTKQLQPISVSVSTRSISTRNTRASSHLGLAGGNGVINAAATGAVRGKRKADCSPQSKTLKRSAFGDVTNAINKAATKTAKQPLKKVTIQSKQLPSVKTVVKPHGPRHLDALAAAPYHKIATRAAAKHAPNQTAVKPKDNKENLPAAANKKRLSNEFEKTDESSYASALEDIVKKSVEEVKVVAASKTTSTTVTNPSSMSFVAQQMEQKLNLGNHEVPENVDDFDQENWNDIFQVSHYAMDIFNYLKERELEFPISDYMDRQICLTRWMRSLLIDWMVEIQESFELNHETLYLGVKLVDMFLSKMTVGKETLQLVGAASMFVASKYDERIPPSIDDFLYICDGAYTKQELLRMEIHLLKVCDFNLGIPISYRFLRRYARCAKMTMPVLTLARFILEFSLMDYETTMVRDSLLASAALFLALKMKKISSWTKTLEFYTGYKLSDILPTVNLLNNGLHKPVKSQLMTVRNKYSHKIFFEVAKIPLVSSEELAKLTI